MTQQNWMEVTFANSRGLTLAGLLHAPEGNTKPVVIMCHGFSGGKEGGGMALQMGEELGTLGFNVLVFDFSGIGASQGLFEDITLTGQIDDLRAAVDWCTSRGMGPVYTLGRSFGGTTAICHGARDTRVAGVCTWAAPASLVEVFGPMADGPVDDEGEMYALAGPQGIAYLRKGFFTDLEQYDVPALAGQLAPRPLLLIHGQNDNVVPPRDAELIYNGAREPKQLIPIPGGDHQLSNHYRLVWDICFQWLKNACDAINL